MEKKENDPKYISSLEKIQALLQRLESEMNKVFHHTARTKPDKWIEHLHQSKNVLSLCSDELCSWLTFWGLDSLGEKFRLLYHVHKVFVNLILEDNLNVLKKLQHNPSKPIGLKTDGSEYQSKVNVVEFHEDVTLRRRSKEDLVTMNALEFQMIQREREKEVKRKLEEEREEEREERVRKQRALQLETEVIQVTQRTDTGDSRPTRCSSSPKRLIDKGSEIIRSMVKIHEKNSKELQEFLSERRELPKNRMDMLTKHLKDMLNREEVEGDENDSEPDDAYEEFIQSIQGKEKMNAILQEVDAKQKDLVIRALSYYRNRKNRVKLDKGTGPDPKIFDLDELLYEKESLLRNITDLEKDGREKYVTIRELKQNLETRAEALQKSLTEKKKLEAELNSYKSQLDLFRKELSDKSNQFYSQTETVIKLKEQENIVKNLRNELKMTESKLELSNKTLAALRDETVMNRTRRDDSIFQDSFNMDTRERNKSVVEPKQVLDSKDTEPPIMIEDRQRSKSMMPQMTKSNKNNILDEITQQKSIEDGGKGGTSNKTSPQSTISDNFKKRTKTQLMQIEEDEGPLGKSRKESEGIEQETTKSRKKISTNTPKKERDAENERKKSQLLEEILREKGLPLDGNETDLSMIDMVKEELFAKRSVPMKTMSLADFQPPTNEKGRVPPSLPRLMNKFVKVNMQSKQGQRSITESRSVSPRKKFTTGASGPIAQLKDLQMEKERAYQALLERSLGVSVGIYKPLPEMKNTPEQAMRKLSTNERKGSEYTVNVRRESGSFEHEMYKSKELDLCRVSKISSINNDYNTIGLESDHCVNPQEIGEATADSSRITIKGHNHLYSIGKLDKGQEMKRSSYIVYASGQSSRMDLNESAPVNTKVKSETVISDREIEALYSFIRTQGDSAAAKTAIMRSILEYKKPEKKSENIIEKMEEELQNVTMLKSLEAFKETVQDWMQEHRICSKECSHLKRCYEKIGFRKGMADIKSKDNMVKTMKIPLAVLAGPLPAESSDTGRKRVRGVL